MTEEEIKVAVKKAIEKVQDEPLEDESKSLSDNGLESLELLEVIMELETEFDAEIEDHRLNPRMTLDDVVKELSYQLSNK